jgi:signal transduction histidine kinase
MPDFKTRVLLVASNTAECERIRCFLDSSTSPFDVITATTCREALNALEDGDFSVILSDCRLSDGAGLDILGQFTGVPLVLLAEPGDEELAARALKFGACGCVVKQRGGGHLALVPVVVAKAAEDAKELKRLNGEVRRRNQQIDEFAFIASHDLKEPLATVRMFIEFLREELPSELSAQATVALNTVSLAAERMQTLIENLLKLSRYGSQAMRWEPVSLDECVDQAVKDLEAFLKDNEACIVRSSLPTVCGDVTLLTLLYQNLIGNAVKFSAERPARVEFSAERLNGNWILGVRDNGIGIPRKCAEEIFLPFKRLHSRLDYDGTGMGLAHCHKIVRLHEGQIWVESELGKGSHFKFTLGGAQPA